MYRPASPVTKSRPARLLCQLSAMCGSGIPVLLGVSRKSFVGAVKERDVEDWLLAPIAPARSADVDIIWVYDVLQTCDTISMLEVVLRTRVIGRAESAVNGGRVGTAL